VKSKIAIILSLLILLCSCAVSNKKPSFNYVGSSTKGVWFSFSEINQMLQSENGLEAELKSAVENCKKLQINNVYIHLRSYCDSLYPSKLFPLIKSAARYDYDVFEMMLEAFHQSSIKVHAWINPYRVLSSSSDVEKLSKDSPAYKWLKDENKENDKNVLFYNGIYLNPAETEVQKLIIDGVKEIITNYDVDGIHLDDYFYPTKNEYFDKISYEKYKNGSKNSLNLDDWRRFNVNNLLSGCYSAIKYYNKNIVFSVSPAASIEKNYTDLYADIKEWISGGYVDAIIPQLYFGYNYSDEAFRFNNILKNWLTLCKDNDVELLIGLAPYKIGTATEADGTEWQTETDILARQVKECYENERISGYIFFSYSSLFSEESLNTKQREAILEFTSGTGGQDI